MSDIDSRRPLTPKQARFVDEFLIDLNATQAAIRAGYAPSNARHHAARMLTKANIQAKIASSMAARSQRTEIAQDDVLRALHHLAFGDVRDLVEFHRYNCRHCWGKGFRRQWTTGEWTRAMAEHEDKVLAADANGRKPPRKPDLAGGTGFRRTRDPNPDCPECDGEGIGRVLIHDTRHLSDAGRTMYAGVRESRDGLEVRINSREKALELLARHVGLFNEQIEVNMTVTTPAELDALYKAKMAEIASRTAAVKGRSARLDHAEDAKQ